MTRDISSILVLGAGELGTFVLESLAQHAARGEIKISVMLRSTTITTQDETKRKQLDHFKDLGIGFVAGDIEKQSDQELAPIFAPFDTVIVCTGMYSPSGTQTKIAKAVLAAEVKLFLPWQYGLDYDQIGKDSAQDLFTEQLGVRDLLRGQTKTEWIIVSTGLFISFLFEDSFGIVTKDRKTVRGLGSWENTVSVTEAEDIGKMVAEVVLVEKDIASQVVYIAGETISYSAIAEVVERAGSAKINRELWTVDKLKADLASDPENYITKYRIVFAQGNGTSWPQDRTLNHARSIPLLDVQGWLQKHPL